MYNPCFYLLNEKESVEKRLLRVFFPFLFERRLLELVILICIYILAIRNEKKLMPQFHSWEEKKIFVLIIMSTTSPGKIEDLFPSKH